MSLQQKYVTFTLDGERFGVPMGMVRDVSKAQELAPVPLAPKAVKGMFSWRGRVATVLDLRARLGLAAFDEEATPAFVLIEDEQELVALMVDAVVDVTLGDPATMEKTPASLRAPFRNIASGVLPAAKPLLLLNIARTTDLAA